MSSIPNMNDPRVVAEVLKRAAADGKLAAAQNTVLIAQSVAIAKILRHLGIAAPAATAQAPAQGAPAAVGAQPAPQGTSAPQAAQAPASDRVGADGSPLSPEQARVEAMMDAAAGEPQ